LTPEVSRKVIKWRYVTAAIQVNAIAAVAIAVAIAVAVCRRRCLSSLLSLSLS
jgi:hypothetical protein